MEPSAISSITCLPKPVLDGDRSLEDCLASRRSQRDFAGLPLDAASLGQLLWAAQGVVDKEGRRTAPSAGGLQGLDIYVARPEGVFRYDPVGHRLVLERTGDVRRELARAAGGQEFVAEAPVTIVLVGVQGAIHRRYGEARGTRYVILEAGHAAQNLLLQATALRLAAVPVGAFEDAEVKRLLGLTATAQPLYLLPVGTPPRD